MNFISSQIGGVLRKLCGMKPAEGEKRTDDFLPFRARIDTSLRVNLDGLFLLETLGAIFQAPKIESFRIDSFSKLDTEGSGLTWRYYLSFVDGNGCANRDHFLEVNESEPGMFNCTLYQKVQNLNGQASTREGREALISAMRGPELSGPPTDDPVKQVTYPRMVDPGSPDSDPFILQEHCSTDPKGFRGYDAELMFMYFSRNIGTSSFEVALLQRSTKRRVDDRSVDIVEWDYFIGVPIPQTEISSL